MKKFFIISLLFFSAMAMSHAQVDTTAIGDTLQQPAQGVDATINQNVNNIQKTINEAISNAPIPKHLLPSKDSLNIFDSLHGKLTVVVKNIHKVIGNLHVALFNNYMNFVNNGPVFRGSIVPVTAAIMNVMLDSIPTGTYSVAVFHDEDKNGVLSKNQLNIPLEGYGFSNNIAAGFGPPNYNQTKFYYSGKNKTISVNMIYFRFPK